jgi:UPF0755 protein
VNHPYPDYPAAEPAPENSSQHPADHLFEDSEVSPRTRRPARDRQRRRRRRTIVMLVVVAFFVAVIVGITMMLRAWLGADEVEDYAGPGEGEVTVTVPQGAGPIVIGSILEEQDVVAAGEVFAATLQSQAEGREVQPGDYVLKHQMSSKDAASVLLGEDASRVHYAALNQNLRLNEALDVLAQATRIPLADFQQLASTPQHFGLPAQAVSMEGYLAPGEYRFPVEMTAEEILQQLVDKTFEELEGAGVTDPAEQYRILTIASIIEAEAGEADYATVGGAIRNRLEPSNTETSGLIQSDATVTYGLDRKSYELTPEEKADTSNPYNTYAHAGLPVGPIGSPSQPAIEAAVNPADVPYFYWVTVNLDSGETKFSETLAEHNGYVTEYQRWCGQNPGRCV